MDADFLEIFFSFANTYTEESVLHGFTKARQEEEAKPTIQKMKRLGYSDEEIAKMDLRKEGNR
jgi:DNA-binding transcriptional regulator YhcF (GntR family)